MNYFVKFRLYVTVISFFFFSPNKVYSQKISLGKYTTSNTELVLLENNKFEETILFDVGVLSFGNYITRNDSLILNYNDGDIRKFKIIKVKQNFIKLRYKRELNNKIRTVKMYKLCAL